MASKRMMGSSNTLLNLLKTNKIIHDPAAQLISIYLNSHSATVEYNVQAGVYDLLHTSIPDEYQNQGLGKILAERVFDYLVSRKQKFRLTCEFLQYFYSKHEDKYKKFVVE